MTVAQRHVPASAAGTAAATGDASTNFATVGDTITVQVGAGAPVTFTFTNSGGDAAAPISTSPTRRPAPTRSTACWRR